MSFEFTERIATFFERFLAVTKDSILKKFETHKEMTPEELENEMDEDDDEELRITSRSFKGFELTVSTQYCRDDDDGSIDFSSLMIYAKMKYGKILLDSIIIRDDFDELNIFIQRIIKTYHICKCEKYLSKRDGWCDSCYPYVYRQDDNCCICMENSGVWIELKCKHTLHEYCWSKVVGNKCPLCRNDQEFKFKYEKI
jgi:hypothetical protein